MHHAHKVSGKRVHFMFNASACRLGNIETGEIGTSNFVKPLGIHYELDGKRRKCVLPCHTSLASHLYQHGGLRMVR